MPRLFLALFGTIVLGLAIVAPSLGSRQEEKPVINPCPTETPYYSGVTSESLRTNSGETYLLQFAACMTSTVNYKELTLAYNNAKEDVYRADNDKKIHTAEDVKSTAQDFIDRFPTPSAPHGLRIKYIVEVEKK